MNAGDWGQILSAVFTAIAAGAAFLAVKQTGDQWRADREARAAEARAEREPEIHPQILLNQSTGTTDLAVINIGGIAKALAFELVLPDQRCHGYVGDGFLLSGEAVHIHTQLPHNEDAELVVMCLGFDDSSYAWNRLGARKIYRFGPTGAATTTTEIWRSFYGDRPLKGLPVVGYRVDWRRHGGLA